MMIVKREKINKQGKRELLIVLEKDEFVKPINKNEFYKLGYPHEDIIHPQILLEARKVYWASDVQEWIES